MNIRNYIKYTVLALIISLALTSFTFAENADINSVKSIRFGSSSRGVRLVLDVATPVDYQVHSIQDSSEILIDIFDADLDTEFSMPEKSTDKLIQAWEITRPNFRQVTFKIQLPYGVPPENIRTFILKNPERIIIDIDRDFKNIQEFQLTKNILWTRREQASDNKYVFSNDLFVNHKSPDVKVNIGLAKSSGNPRETIASMVTRTGAVAGINGGYFANDGENLGLVVIDGKIVAPSVKRRPPRSVFGINSTGNVFIDRVFDKDGKLFTVVNNMWEGMVIALGGGPRLITNGNITINAEEEALGKGGNDITRPTGRTALGVDKKNNIVMTTISSYHDNHKSGVQLPELANHLLSRGVVNALNLDGGGSTEMSVLGTHVSNPPGGSTWKRPVTNGVLVFDKSPVTAPVNINIEPAELVFPADGTTTGNVRIMVTDANGKPVPDGTQVRISSNAGIFRRRFHSLKKGTVEIPVSSLRTPGNYRIKVTCGSAEAFLPVKFISGEPSLLDMKVTEQKVISAPDAKNNDAETPEKTVNQKQFIIETLIRDSYKNGLKGKAVEFTILEGQGKFGQQKILTTEGGAAKNSFEMTSDNAKIQVSTEGLPPATHTINTGNTGEGGI
jgi:exopolysaccharide biosynthesis protein